MNGHETLVDAFVYYCPRCRAAGMVWTAGEDIPEQAAISRAGNLDGPAIPICLRCAVRETFAAEAADNDHWRTGAGPLPDSWPLTADQLLAEDQLVADGERATMAAKRAEH